MQQVENDDDMVALGEVLEGFVSILEAQASEIVALNDKLDAQTVVLMDLLIRVHKTTPDEAIRIMNKAESAVIERNRNRKTAQEN